MKQNFTVRQGALDGVEAFLSVAQHRSFRRAAGELGVTPSAISQAVRALEARLGAALFIRTTRSVGLTEAGQRFFSRAKPAFEELVAASGAARELGQRPAGLLRLSVPRAVVPILLDPLIASFCKAYPEVEVEISASEELIDLAAQGRSEERRVGKEGRWRWAAEQAEDGIRDGRVTGVQTCALPIWSPRAAPRGSSGNARRDCFGSRCRARSCRSCWIR